MQIRMLKRQAMEAVEDMEEMRRTHKDNAHVSMQLLKKVGRSAAVLATVPRERSFFGCPDALARRA